MRQVKAVEFQRLGKTQDIDSLFRADSDIDRAPLLVEQACRVGPRTTSPEFVRDVIAARRKREQVFTGDLFADPAWDILLELYVLHCEQRRTSVSSLCMAAAVPATTALRWIEKLQHDELLERTPDPLDARRVWVKLSSNGVEKMRTYLETLSGQRFVI